jgi:hypothetical protein
MPGDSCSLLDILGEMLAAGERLMKWVVHLHIDVATVILLILVTLHLFH